MTVFRSVRQTLADRVWQVAVWLRPAPRVDTAQTPCPEAKSLARSLATAAGDLAEDHVGDSTELVGEALASYQVAGETLLELSLLPRVVAGRAATLLGPTGATPEERQALATALWSTTSLWMAQREVSS